MSHVVVRRRLSILIAHAALLAVVGSIGPAAAQAKPTTLHLNAVVYDLHKTARVYSSRERLFVGTSKVGEDSSRCVLVSKIVQCTGSYTLAHGTLKIAGTLTSPTDPLRITLKITGGTGSYKGAHGTVVTVYNKTETKAKETLTFS
jgi:hypothetical protein